MKSVKHIISSIFVLCLLNRCVDPATLTIIKIVNKSSYDLHISFYLYPDYEQWYNDIDLIKNQSVSFELHGAMSYEYRNPNNEIEKILFSNLDNNEKIKEYINNDYNLFKLTGSEEGRNGGGKTGYFLLEIDDDLLK